MRPFPSWQVPFLGLKRFPRALTRFEIDTFFVFGDPELAAIAGVHRSGREPRRPPAAPDAARNMTAHVPS